MMNYDLYRMFGVKSGKFQDVFLCVILGK